MADDPCRGRHPVGARTRRAFFTASRSRRDLRNQVSRAFWYPRNNLGPARRRAYTDDEYKYTDTSSASKRTSRGREIPALIDLRSVAPRRSDSQSTK
jgi:hypothetical protein